jgi:hypothetical protein
VIGDEFGAISKLDSLGAPPLSTRSNEEANPKKTSAKRIRLPRPAKHAGAKHPRSQQNKGSVTLDADGKLTFNHAMVYVKDVERGLAFYRDLLGRAFPRDGR